MPWIPNTVISSGGGTGTGQINYETRSSNVQLVAADTAKSIDLTATFTQTFAACAALGAGWWVILRVQKTSTTLPVVTLDPSGAELINGVATLRASAGVSILVTCTGTALNAQCLEGALTPYDVPNLHGWWDAADAATITDAGGGAVSQWADKSPKANNVTEATNRPTTGTRTINGLNTLDFDGSNDQLRNTSLTNFIQPEAVYVVVETDTIAAGNRIILRTNGACSIFNASAILQTEMPGSSGVAGGLSVGVPALCVGRNLTNTISMAYVGGVGAGGPVGGASPAITEIDIGCQSGGGSLFWDGKMAELIWLGQPVSELLDLQMRNYLANKWAVTA